MASYRIQADLMAYVGAQYINAKARPRKEGESDESYAKVPVVSGVFIPDKFNDISVQVDNSKEGFRNASGLTARLALNVFPLQTGNDANGQPRPDQKLIESVKIRVQQGGEEVTAYNIPSMSVNASFRKEFMEDMRKKMAAREIVRHPEWAGTTEDTNADLRRAVSMAIPYRLGLGYLREPKNTVANVAAPTPVAFADFGSPFAPQGQTANYASSTYTKEQNAVPSEAPIDDLPF